MPGCPTCGTARDSWQKLRVHHRSAHGESLPNRECERCGERFYCGHPRKYCSEECRYESREIDHSGANNPNYSGAKETTECEQCGDAFDYYPSEKAGRLCSDCVDATEWQEPPALAGAANPNYDGGKLRLVCDVCERRFERYPSNVGDGATLCSNECRAAWLSDEYAGSGHPNWNGGPTGSYGPGWRQVRERALERDGYACVLCGADSDDLGRSPDVHHIVPVRRFLENPVTTVADAHTLDNVVCLCPGCHRRAEHGAASAAELRHRTAVGHNPHTGST